MKKSSDRRTKKSSNPKITTAKSTLTLNDELMSTTSLALKTHAKALDIPTGSAEIFIKNSLDAAKKSLRNRQLITEADFTRAVAKELKKYHPDLAYVYENYDKII